MTENNNKSIFSISSKFREEGLYILNRLKTMGEIETFSENRKEDCSIFTLTKDTKYAKNYIAKKLAEIRKNNRSKLSIGILNRNQMINILNELKDKKEIIDFEEIRCDIVSEFLIEGETKYAKEYFKTMIEKLEEKKRKKIFGLF